uniref:Uncharacterized protein n=1 Tax=Parascaris equorum TaxID=6256 RepID=A0A914S9U1_PAREQ
MRHKLQDDDERLLARERDGTVRPTSMSKILLMVMLYYPLSIGLTFYQKWFIKSYKLPLLIAACHYLVKYSMAVVVRCVLESFAFFLRIERWHPSLGVAAALIASGNCSSSQLDVRGLLLVELAAACTGVRWTVSQLVMQNEQKCSLRHPLDMVAH